MSSLDTVKMDLGSRLERLVEYLASVQESRAAAFFSEISVALDGVSEEADLLEVFLALSTTAFHGFQFDPVAAVAVDDVLAYAEQVSQTYSVATQTVH